MATQGRPIDDSTYSRLVRMLRCGMSRRATAQACRINKSTVDKYARLLGYTKSPLHFHPTN